MQVVLDTNILAHAEGLGDSARCDAARLLIAQLPSEDFQNGFTWRGVTVVNPFTAPVSPLLAGLLSQSNH